MVDRLSLLACPSAISLKTESFGKIRDFRRKKACDPHFDNAGLDNLEYFPAFAKASREGSAV
jgi:hypothetical protein